MKIEQIEKIKSRAMGIQTPERLTACRILAKLGIYIDKAGIEWEKEKLPFLEKSKGFDYYFGFNPLDPTSTD